MAERQRRTFADYGIEIPSGRSGEVDTLCPECSHTRRNHPRARCLSVNTDLGTWHCHHCGWSGGLGGGDRVVPFPVPAGRARPEPPPRAYTRPEPVPESPLPPEVVAWFERRGIPDWVLADNRVAAGPRFVPQLGREATTIQFPYYRDGQLVNVKYRAHPKHFFMVGGAERVLYGLDGLAGAAEVCVVEGEMDKLTVDAVQGPPTVSVPDGAPAADTANYASKFSFLASAESHFEAARRVLVATDTDAPGERLAEELARRIGPWKCLRVRWPEGCKDANETLLAHGQRGVLDALTAAVPWPVAGITTVEELAGPVESLWERGFDRGCAVGWPTFDGLYRPRAGLVTIVTGSPGAGKSHFLDNVLVRLAERHDWPIGVCSPENQPLERHLATILSIRSGRPFGPGPTPRMSREELREGVRWAAGRFAFVLPEEPTLDAVLDRARTLVYRHGAKGLVVDPWNELDHSRPDRMTETEYVSQSLSRLRQFARQQGVHVWLVAHPTKLQKDQRDGAYPVPTPYDISGSAHFYNKADACLSVWRDVTAPGDPTQVHVQKIRFAETGAVGMARFRFDPATGRFSETGGPA